MLILYYTLHLTALLIMATLISKFVIPPLMIMHLHSFGPSKWKGQLDPLVPQTYTSAREMRPVSVREPGNLRRNKAQIVPQSKNELMENGASYS